MQQADDSEVSRESGKEVSTSKDGGNLGGIDMRSIPVVIQPAVQSGEVSACCVNKESTPSLQKVTIWITQVLKMEEDVALTSSPEMKEVIALL